MTMYNNKVRKNAEMYYTVFSFNTLPINYVAWTFLPQQSSLSNQQIFQKQQFSEANPLNQKISTFQSQGEGGDEKISKSQHNQEIKLQQNFVDYENKTRKRSRRRSLSLQTREKDDQFLPNMKNQSKKRKFAQNTNRNVIPNIMHQVMSFIFKKNRSGSLVQKLLKEMNVQKCTLKRFYTYQFLFKNKINHYVNGDSLLIVNQLQEPECEVYSQGQQECYMKICRTLIEYFFTHEFDVINLTSNRMKSDKRIDHLKTKRSLLYKFKEGLRT